MKKVKPWRQKWFGTWREMGSEYSKCPSIYDWIITEKGKQYCDDLTKIIHYLEFGYCLAATSAIMFPNVITGEQRSGSLCFRTDGVWVWQDDLVDYMVKNNVVIPDEFYSHMKKRLFILPDELSESSIRFEELEWPPT